MAEQVAPSPEGWFCFHLFRKIDRSNYRQVPSRERQDCLDEFAVLVSVSCIRLQYEGKGGRYWCRVNGQEADLGLMILREMPDGLQEIETSLEKLHLFDHLVPTISYVSVTEVCLYSGDPTTDRGWFSISTPVFTPSRRTSPIYLHLPHVENPPTGCQLVHNSLRPPLDQDA